VPNSTIYSGLGSGTTVMLSLTVTYFTIKFFTLNNFRSYNCLKILIHTEYWEYALILPHFITTNCPTL
jgi:hypothetical protein